MNTAKKVTSIIMLIIIIIIVVGVINIIKNQKIPIIAYHNIAKKEEAKNLSKDLWVEVCKFEKEMKYLSENNYKSLTLDEFYKWKNGKLKVPYKSVLITFDDGLLSNYEYAFPILKKYNLNAVVFLIGEYTAESGAKWNGDLKSYMSMDLINECKEKYPNIDFQSHTYGMHDNKDAHNKTYEEFIEDNKKFKETILDAKYAAYPFGDYSKNMEKAFKDSGYKLVFGFGPTSKEFKKASKQDNDFRVRRLSISQDMSLKKFKLRLIIPF